MKQRRPFGPSRRALIAGAATTPLLVAGGASHKSPTASAVPTMMAPISVDPTVDIARQCLALHRENERLHRRYGTVEAWPAENYNWFNLNEAQQRALPAGRKLHDIKDRFAVLAKERPRTMRQLRRTPATSLDGAIGKLMVVAAAIAPDEFPSAHRLLKSTISNLRALQ